MAKGGCVADGGAIAERPATKSPPAIVERVHESVTGPQ
jgi:hypothetical protein